MTVTALIDSLSRSEAKATSAFRDFGSKISRGATRKISSMMAATFAVSVRRNVPVEISRLARPIVCVHRDRATM